LSAQSKDWLPTSSESPSERFPESEYERNSDRRHGMPFTVNNHGERCPCGLPLNQVARLARFDFMK
jgi:hypothetical protein